jgi:hypothetical protein
LTQSVSVTRSSWTRNGGAVKPMSADPISSWQGYKVERITSYISSSRSAWIRSLSKEVNRSDLLHAINMGILSSCANLSAKIS